MGSIVIINFMGGTGCLGKGRDRVAGMEGGGGGEGGIKHMKKARAYFI